MQVVRFHHVAFVFKTRTTSICVDFGCFSPIGSLVPDRTMACVCTHQHPDHFDRAKLIAIGAPVYAPGDTINLLDGAGLKTTRLRLSKPVHIGDVKVTTVPADHGPKLSKPIENVGLLIEHAGIRIYFAGDIARISQPLPRGPFDLVIVPVAGGGFVFDAAEAVEFVRALKHRGRTVPVHDSGPSEPGCIQLFVKLASPHCAPMQMYIGESICLPSQVSFGQEG